MVGIKREIEGKIVAFSLDEVRYYRLINGRPHFLTSIPTENRLKFNKGFIYNDKLYPIANVISYNRKHSIEEINLITKLFIQSRNLDQKCLNPLCNNLAISSHVHQENRILNQISNTQGFFYSLEMDPYTDNLFKFNKRNKSNAPNFVFNGFCGNNCDQRIFSKIETGSVDFYKYENQLLVSIR